MADKWQSVLCALVIVPVVEAAAWAILRAVGGEQGATVFVGVAGGTYCGVYVFGPARWLADPHVAGRFGREHPWVARLICLVGMAGGLGLAALVALGS